MLSYYVLFSLFVLRVYTVRCCCCFHINHNHQFFPFDRCRWKGCCCLVGVGARKTYYAVFKMKIYYLNFHSLFPPPPGWTIRSHMKEIHWQHQKKKKKKFCNKPLLLALDIQRIFFSHFFPQCCLIFIYYSISHLQNSILFLVVVVVVTVVIIIVINNNNNNNFLFPFSLFVCHHFVTCLFHRFEQ